MVSLVMGRRRGKEGVASTVVFFTIALLALSNTASSLRSRFSFLISYAKREKVALFMMYSAGNIKARQNCGSGERPRWTMRTHTGR